MNTDIAVPAKNHWGGFLTTLVLALPSTVALLCALALKRDVAWLPAPSTWLIYITSQYVAYLSIVISAGIVVAETIQHTTSRKSLLLMGLSLVGAVLVLWYAVQIFNEST